MALQAYIDRFRRLNVNRSRSHSSPHKVAMLLAVMDLLEAGRIAENKISFDDELIRHFKQHFDMLRSGSDQPTPQLPYYHLKGDGFWHHEVLAGKDREYADLAKSLSAGRLRNAIAYAYLDSELYELLRFSVTREVLKHAFENMDIDVRDDLQGAIGSWSALECELIVADYLNMLVREMREEPFSKAEHRRNLRPHLNNRSEGSVEYKHQNISAILIDLGLPYLRGYKPAFNYQRLLREVVASVVKAHAPQIEAELERVTAAEPLPPAYVVWDRVLEAAPELSPATEAKDSREYAPRIYDYANKEQRNLALGQRGEEFVLEYERHRLTVAGRSDLAREVEWTSKKRGDGAGYDIRSFKPDGDQELYIEVKTTNAGKFQPFLISENEVAFSKEHTDRYSLYRIFDFSRSVRMFVLPGNIQEHVRLAPRLYQARFR